MRCPRGRSVALATAAAAILVLGVAILLLRDRLLVEWHLRRLETGDEAARIQAAERLGEMRAVRAVPRLVQGLLRESASYLEARSKKGWRILTGDPDRQLTEVGRACKRALIAIGPGATPAVMQGMLDEKDFLGSGQLFDVVLAVHETPGASAAPRQPSIPVVELVLTALRDDVAQPAETRRLAALVLEQRVRR